MIRRLVIAIGFALLGIPSLLVLRHTYGWFCATFASICAPYGGPCPGLDTCAFGVGRSVMVSAFFLGPFLLFGLTAFRYSSHPRRWVEWGVLAVVLTLMHSLIAISFIQIRNHVMWG